MIFSPATEFIALGVENIGRDRLFEGVL